MKVRWSFLSWSRFSFLSLTVLITLNSQKAEGRDRPFLQGGAAQVGPSDGFGSDDSLVEARKRRRRKPRKPQRFEEAADIAASLIPIARADGSTVDSLLAVDPASGREFAVPKGTFPAGAPITDANRVSQVVAKSNELIVARSGSIFSAEVGLKGPIDSSAREQILETNRR